MQIWQIVGGGKTPARWNKKDFMKFPEDCEKKPLLNAILEHLRKCDEGGHYEHWIVFSKEEEEAFETLAKIFVTSHDTKQTFLEALCKILKEIRTDAPFATCVQEDEPNVPIGKAKNFRLAFKFQ